MNYSSPLSKRRILRSLTLLLLVITGHKVALAQAVDDPNNAGFGGQPKVESSDDPLPGLTGSVGCTKSGPLAPVIEAPPPEQSDERIQEDMPATAETNASDIDEHLNRFLKPEFRELQERTKDSDVRAGIYKPDSGRRADNGTADKFYWAPAIAESLTFLGIQHGFRMTQKKTRDELSGKFFPEWFKSAKNLSGWRDGDSFITNYLAHTMQGTVTGRIFVNNSEKSGRQEFGKSREYWISRFKAMAWSAAWSTQFEIGPISEASIGNVGLYDDAGPNRMGWVDLVVTPTAGTGLLIGEDVIDKYILKNWLEKRRSRTRIKILRTFLTPFQSFTNVLGGRVPWKRNNR